MDFRTEIPSVEARRREAEQLLEAHPKMIPTILEAPTKELRAQLMQNKCETRRFLIPAMYTFHEFTQVIRRRLLVGPNDSVVLTVRGNVLPEMEQAMMKIYEKYRAEDLFLYISYSREVVYG